MKILKTANYEKNVQNFKKKQETKPVKMPNKYRTQWDPEEDFKDRMKDEFSGESDKKKNDALDDKWNILFNKDKKREPAFAKNKSNHKKAFDMGRYESEGMLGEDTNRYKSDEDIASEFTGMTINEIQVNPSRRSGWIDISFPEAEEHVGGGASEITDHWIKYDNGKIAFDNWYPTETSAQLIDAIEKKLQERERGQIDTPMGLEDDNPVSGIDY